MTVRRVLVIGPSNIGDGILVCEVVARVRQAYPKAHLALLVGERAALLFEEDPRIQQLINMDRHEDAGSRVRLFLRLWGWRPQVIVDLRSTAFPFLLKPWRAWQYARRPPARLHHMHDRHLWKLEAQAPDVVRRVPKLTEPVLYFGPRDRQQVEHILKRWNLPAGRPCALLCPGARSHTKRWQPESFAAVAERLHRELGMEIVFSGEPDEKSIIDEIQSRLTVPSHSCVGLATIRQLGLLMQRMRVVVTNDSASLHMASLMNVPTVAIFGPTDARKYGPWGSRGIAIRRRLFCSPCEQPLCRYNHECMRYVSSDEVMSAVKEVIDGKPGQSIRQTA